MAYCVPLLPLSFFSPQFTYTYTLRLYDLHLILSSHTIVSFFYPVYFNYTISLFPTECFTLHTFRGVLLVSPFAKLSLFNISKPSTLLRSYLHQLLQNFSIPFCTVDHFPLHHCRSSHPIFKEVKLSLFIFPEFLSSPT